MQFVVPEDYPEDKAVDPLPQLFNPGGFSLPFEPPELEKIVKVIEDEENLGFQILELVYVNEQKILEINKEYLGQEYVTDIISFRYDDQDNHPASEGTLYCCAPRIAEQAAEFGTGQKEEFLRIFIHGLLHLAGYRDDTPESKQKMSALEDHYLERAGL